MGFLAKLARARRDFSEYRQAAARQRAAEASLHAVLVSRLAAMDQNPPPPAAGARTLVMGLASNYGPAELSPFVRSLRGCGYRGEAALFLANPAPGTRAFLEAHDIKVLAFEELPLLAMSMNSARMFRYLDHVSGEVLGADGGSDYARVMLTDLRDVVFQGDPFAAIGPEEMQFFLERPGRTIGNCRTNAAWMRAALGEAALRRAAEAPVSCAGTLIGTPRAMLVYLLHMCRLILEAPVLARRSGIDQAIHNHILLEGLVRGAVAVPNGQAVMTVPDDAPHGLAADAQGVLRHAEHGASAVVHQYDRDPVLAAGVAARWGLQAAG